MNIMWKYDIKLINFNTYSELIEKLNEEGKKGWEVFNYEEEKPIKFGSNYKAKVLFKRFTNEITKRS